MVITAIIVSHLNKKGFVYWRIRSLLNFLKDVDVLFFFVCYLLLVFSSLLLG